MSSKLNEMATAERIAGLVGVSPSAVRKRLADMDCIAGATMSGGRPVALYNIDVVKLWNPDFDTKQLRPTLRKQRVDAGGVRSKSPRCVEILTTLAEKYYMGNAVPDCRLACRRAIQYVRENIANYADEFTLAELDDCARSDWLYKAYIARSDRRRRGCFYTDGWVQRHRAHWRKLDAAYGSGHTRYNIWRIAENDFGACRGSGFGKFIMIDDRKSDAWTIDKSDAKQRQMPYALYAWDCLTGALLWVEPAPTISRVTYAACIINVTMRWGLHNTVWFLENAAAAANEEVRALVEALYTPAEVAEWNTSLYSRFFQGQKFIVRNVPHIATAFGKAIGERLFAEIKRADAMFFPESYHGENPSAAVQLRRASVPVLSSKYTPDAVEYFDAITKYAWGTGYLDYERDSLREWAKAHGDVPPTRRSMVEYYMPSELRFPAPWQIEKLCYFALKHSEVRMTRLGSLRVTIDRREYNLRADELYDYSLYKQKLRICRIPFDDRKFLIYQPRHGAHPQFVCVAEDFTVNSADDLDYRDRSRQMRESNLQEMEDSVPADAAEFSTAVRREYLALPAQNILPKSDDSDDIIDAEIVTDDVIYAAVITDSDDDKKPEKPTDAGALPLSFY